MFQSERYDFQRFPSITTRPDWWIRARRRVAKICRGPATRSGRPHDPVHDRTAAGHAGFSRAIPGRGEYSLGEGAPATVGPGI